MLTAANGIFAVYRDTTTDDYGDEVDDNTTPTLTGIPARITEQTRRVTTAADPTPRTIRWLVGRVELGTDIRADDRMINEQTGAVFLVDAVSSIADGALTGDTRLDLRRTT